MTAACSTCHFARSGDSSPWCAVQQLADPDGRVAQPSHALGGASFRFLPGEEVQPSVHRWISPGVVGGWIADWRTGAREPHEWASCRLWAARTKGTANVTR